MNYLELLAANLNVSITFLIIILLWSSVWKLLALWKSGRNNHLVWFIVLAIVNTAGILPILYIFIFSKMGKKPKKKR